MTDLLASSHLEQKVLSGFRITVQRTYPPMYMASIIEPHLMVGLQTTRFLANTKTTIIRMSKMLEPFGTMLVPRSDWFEYANTDYSQDHTEYTTGINVYLGLEGFYFLTDDEELALNLPTGKYDVPLALSAKQYSNSGTLVYNSNRNFGLPGDVIQVSVSYQYLWQVC
jgi:hypothetical protein